MSCVYTPLVLNLMIFRVCGEKSRYSPLLGKTEVLEARPLEVSDGRCQSMSWQTFSRLLLFLDLLPGFIDEFAISMPVVEAVISFYRRGEEKPIER